MVERCFAVGDIHGCADELDRLLGAIDPRAGDTVVFVGDYIDRGPDSKAVVDRLIAWRDETPARTVFLKGNHEDMALGYLGRDGHWSEAWLRNGGNATLRSYGGNPGEERRVLLERIPPSHVTFLDGLVMSHRWRNHLFVHAGIRPGVPLEEQNLEDLLWIREEFLDRPHDLGATVVFGHTPYRRVFVDRPYKLGIDTGCVYGGALTCLVLPEERLVQVRLGDGGVHEVPLDAASRRRP